ncbi:hypothetical protein T11_680 [Trichinella zimbabwensis]|uniref:Uncharacterized protein n=1 Tax=Trichinella zimbabwensis TaxID=268475 RepID=A0A0V1GX32_9BILA|nr:hypothetical protein T11_680 [Trichinella zimbabwensis]
MNIGTSVSKIQLLMSFWKKRAKLISALPVKSCRCMENYQGCSENVSWAIMVNGHANQIAHVPELFLNDTQVKIDELMPNNQQL